jgi:hypothetical protein
MMRPDIPSKFYVAHAERLWVATLWFIFTFAAAAQLLLFAPVDDTLRVSARPVWCYRAAGLAFVATALPSARLVEYAGLRVAAAAAATVLLLAAGVRCLQQICVHQQ